MLAVGGTRRSCAPAVSGRDSLPGGKVPLTMREAEELAKTTELLVRENKQLRMENKNMYHVMEENKDLRAEVQNFRCVPLNRARGSQGCRALLNRIMCQAGSLCKELGFFLKLSGDWFCPRNPRGRQFISRQSRESEFISGLFARQVVLCRLCDL